MSTPKKDALEKSIDHIEQVIVKQAGCIADFEKSLKKDPLSAIRWGMGAVEAAAKLSVYQQINEALNKGTPLNEVVEFCLHEALRHARYPERSTNPLANILHQEQGAAWTLAHEKLSFNLLEKRQ